MFQPGWTEPMPTMVAAYHSMWSLGRSFLAVPSSANWETTGLRMIYAPITIPRLVVVKKMWWLNGTANTSMNIEAGIYRDTGGFQPGAKVASTGAVTQGAGNYIQTADLSTGNAVLPPGVYWLALGGSVSDASTDISFFRTSGSSSQEGFYKYQESTGPQPGSWPSTATPVEASNSTLWVYGIVTTAYPL